MKSFKIVLAGAGFAVIAALAGPVELQAADDPANVIKYRKSVMGALGGHISAIGAVVKGEASYSQHVAAHAKALHATGLMLGDVFPEGTGEGKTRSLPAIWSEPAKFDSAVKDFQAATAKLAEVAEGGDMAAIGAALGAVGKGCGGCHKPFREEKK